MLAVVVPEHEFVCSMAHGGKKSFKDIKKRIIFRKSCLYQANSNSPHLPLPKLIPSTIAPLSLRSSLLLALPTSRFRRLDLDSGQGKLLAHTSLEELPAANLHLRRPCQDADPGLDIVVQLEGDVGG